MWSVCRGRERVGERVSVKGWSGEKTQTFLFSNDEESGDDFIRRGASIEEVQIIVINPTVSKAALVVHSLVQSDNGSHTLFTKVGDIEFCVRGMIIITMERKKTM